MKALQELVRPNIWNMEAYSSARSEFAEKARVSLDANENPYNAPYNRYPDPLQKELKKKISKVKGVPAENIFLGVGSDEAIDLLYRVFCAPQKDNVVAFEPTYGMYEVCAHTNDVEYRKVPLGKDFSLDAERMMEKVDRNTKILFLCSPNNPTGNVIEEKEIEYLLTNFEGIVVIDEAYVDFSSHPSYTKVLERYPNLVILQTFSKAWGCAGIRLGMAFSSVEIIALFTKIKYPYNINQLTQRTISKVLDRASDVSYWVELILAERKRMKECFQKLPFVEKVYPSDANFLLVKMTDVEKRFQYLIEQGVIVRSRNKISLCEGCLRITLGTEYENDELLRCLWEYEVKRLGKEEKTLQEIELPTREAFVERNTKETKIKVEINLDRSIPTEIHTGLGFFDHMLEQIAKHGGISLHIQTNGDLNVDEHHTIEDTAIALGEALTKALGDKRGISRYGFSLPMDDCLCSVALDFGGRPWLVWNVDFKREFIGDVPTEMFFHFFKSLSDAAKINLNIKAEGGNEHHKIEGVFKAFARALREAIRREKGSNELPSTKGTL